MCVVWIFKQKTAYEMRISVWSSDVCSSDLTTPAPMPPTSTYRQVRGTSAHHTGPHAPNLQLPPGPGHQCPPHRPPCPQPPATARSGAPVPTTPAPMPPTSSYRQVRGTNAHNTGPQPPPPPALRWNW